MKPYGKNYKRIKSKNDKKGKWSRTSWHNFLRRDKKRERQIAKKNISISISI